MKKKRKDLPNFAYEIAGWIGKSMAPFERASLRKLRVAAEGEGNRRQEYLQGCTLFHFQISPFSAKVRRELARLGVEIPMRDVLDDSAAHAELLAGGKRDRVPCLKIEAAGSPAVWMYESDAIVQYLRNTVGAKSIP